MTNAQNTANKSAPIVIGGCPGSGKTTTSRKLATLLPNSVLIETDQFFGFITTVVDPSLREAKLQNDTVVTAYCGVAQTFREAGYQVIIEGVIGPWLLPTLARQLGGFQYFLLHTPLTTALERVAARQSQETSSGIVRRMHPQFEEVLPDYEAVTIMTNNKNADEVVRLVHQRLPQTLPTR